MSLFIASLNSGSNGNCYYIGNEKEAVLIDAGISCREIEQRMKRLAVDIRKVKAIFISHEHTDHIKGVSVLVRKYQLPVFITERTHKNSRLWFPKELINSFASHQKVDIGGISVTPFPKYHDAADPYSFTVSGGATKVGVFTDIGRPCQYLLAHFQQCHAAFLESNYDEQMLEEGSYPIHLKKRIRGGEGHLSNAQALALFKAHRPAFMSHLLLSHLSKNNNDPELVKALFDSHADGVQIIIASRYEETAVYEISNHLVPQKRTAHKPEQMKLVFE